MLKAVFTIDCDFCRKPLEQAAVCDDPDLWESFANDLSVCAEISGWSYHDEWERFLCPTCNGVIEQYREGNLPEEEL